MSGDTVIGGSRRWALMFSAQAALTADKVESLASEIESDLSEIQQSDNLMKYYSELGDAAEQQRILKQAKNGDDIPGQLIFGAAHAAYASGDYKESVELYTRYLKTYPQSSAAYGNRGVSHHRQGANNKALKDYQRAIEFEKSSFPCVCLGAVELTIF